MNKFVIVLLCTILFGYGLFEARRLIQGPIVTITSPTNGSATSTETLTIRGSAHNIAFLTINGKAAFTDTSGNFALTLSPPAGYAIVTAVAVDRFGRHTTTSVAITMLNFCPSS